MSYDNLIFLTLFKYVCHSHQALDSRNYHGSYASVNCRSRLLCGHRAVAGTPSRIPVLMIIVALKLKFREVPVKFDGERLTFLPLYRSTYSIRESQRSMAFKENLKIIIIYCLFYKLKIYSIFSQGKYDLSIVHFSAKTKKYYFTLFFFYIAKFFCFNKS